MRSKISEPVPDFLSLNVGELSRNEALQIVCLYGHEIERLSKAICELAEVNNRLRKANAELWAKHG